MKDARFGIWFHWGVATVSGADGKPFGWYGRHMYNEGNENKTWHLEHFGPDVHFHDLIDQITGEKFDAAQWLDIAERSGAKLFGAMGEHHDGLAFWESDLTPWNTTQVGPKRDIVGELEAETRKRDMRFMVTLHHGFHKHFFARRQNWAPRYTTPKHRAVPQNDFLPPDDPKYSLLYSSHLTNAQADALWRDKYLEVAEKYAPDYIWTDFGPRFIEDPIRAETVTRLFDLASEKGQDITINVKGNFLPSECAIYNTEVRSLPDIQDNVWTVDFTVCPGWYYSGEDPKAYAGRSLFFQRVMLDVISKNGMFQLSFGPRLDGTIPDVYADVMLDIGKWLKAQNDGEGIYGTLPFYVPGEGKTAIQMQQETYDERGADYKALRNLGKKDVRFTRKDNILYIHHLQPDPEADAVLIGSLGGAFEDYFKVNAVSLLGSDENVNWSQDAQGLHLSTPAQPVNPDPQSPYAWKVELADTFIFEAEQAQHEGLEAADALPGARGSYLHGFDQAGDRITFKTHVPTAGEYRLIVRYSADGGALKVGNRLVDVQVNGDTQLPRACLHASEKAHWQTTFLHVQLKAGENTLTLACPDANPAPLDLDHITLLPVM